MTERLNPLEQSPAERQEMLERERDIELLGKLLTDRFPISDEDLERQYIDLVTPDGREFLVESSLAPAHYLQTHVGARPYHYIVEPKRVAKQSALAVSPDGNTENPTFDRFSISVGRDGSCSMIGVRNRNFTPPPRNAIYKLYNDLTAARVTKVN
jgi:hypothetical protein